MQLRWAFLKKNLCPCAYFEISLDREQAWSKTLIILYIAFCLKKALKCVKSQEAKKLLRFQKEDSEEINDMWSYFWTKSK